MMLVHRYACWNPQRMQTYVQDFLNVFSWTSEWKTKRQREREKTDRQTERQKKCQELCQKGKQDPLLLECVIGLASMEIAFWKHVGKGIGNTYRPLIFFCPSHKFITIATKEISEFIKMCRSCNFPPENWTHLHVAICGFLLFPENERKFFVQTCRPFLIMQICDAHSDQPVHVHKAIPWLQWVGPCFWGSHSPTKSSWKKAMLSFFFELPQGNFRFLMNHR